MDHQAIQNCIENIERELAHLKKACGSSAPVEDESDEEMEEPAPGKPGRAAGYEQERKKVRKIMREEKE